MIETNSMIMSEDSSDHTMNEGMVSRQQLAGKLGGKLQARSYNN